MLLATEGIYIRPIQVTTVRRVMSSFPKKLNTAPIDPATMNLPAFETIRVNALHAARQKLLEVRATMIYPFFVTNFINLLRQWRK